MSKMHEDKLLNKIGQWKEEDQSRNEESGEQRADIKSFLELTGWNKTALTWIRRLDKYSEEKREDILRSFDDLRETMDAHWAGQKTADMFQDKEPASFEGEAA